VRSHEPGSGPRHMTDNVREVNAIFTLLRSSREENITAKEDYVVLADRSAFIVPRANLAAAKELLATQRTAGRQVAVRRQRAAIAS
jgi:hypothetical protein